ncbi:MAG: glutathione S-transferase family protein [Gammaproteobacteria bacterium]|nr:glutathione S-transferase family protein [Gammaproteobacteria bacterium]
MKLYWFQVAPNPTKVRLYVAEKNAGGAGIVLDDAIVKLPKGEQRTAEFRALNPFGSLPVLELDDGSTVVESLPIIDYLEELHPAPPLWGETPRERVRARELERIADVRLMMPIARYIHATRSPIGLPPNPAVAEHAQGVWPAALQYLDDALADGREFVCGARPSVADCTLAAALQFARFGEVALDLADHAHLSRWDAAYRAREVARAVLTL